MKTKVIVPQVGESIARGMLALWLKKEGAAVHAGDDLFELETEKATVSVPAPADGTLSITVPAGSDVTIGQEVGAIDTEGALASTAKRETKQPSVEPAPQPKSKAPLEEPAKKTASEIPLSPAVRRIVAEKNLKPESIHGTGKDGRLLKADVLAETPAEQIARLKIATPASVAEESGLVTRTPMSEIRKTIARRLVQAQSEAALLTTFNEIDMQEVMTLREKHGPAFLEKYKVKLGFMSFFIKAVTRALTEMPEVGSRIEGTDIVTPRFTDIGVAVATDRGLIVPVIRNADRLRFDEIEAALADLAARARDRKIKLEELQGGTFTITNGGVFGSLLSTPIPNYPQAAILGMHAIKKRPVAIDDAVVIRPMMYVALTYDHRLIDGRQAVQFLVRVKDLVEEPEDLLLGV